MKSKILDILESISPEADFVESENYISDGIFDSFDIIMITTALEEAFQISIPGDRITAENFSSLINLEALVKYCLEGTGE